MDFWSLLTASEDRQFENQYFDRKEAGRPDPATKVVSNNKFGEVLAQVCECISAFANENIDGGFVAVGISKDGTIKGLSHLTDEQERSLTHINERLRNHATTCKLIDCQNENGQSDRICLLFVPHTSSALCETTGAQPKAWKRSGAQNVLLSETQRDQMRREKGIISHDIAPCCPYDPSEVDQGIVAEFRRVFLENTEYEYTTDELLYRAGAIIKNGNGYSFTFAGFLFFCSNPQRLLPWSCVRLLHFDTTHDRHSSRPLPSREREFSGPITKQIRDIRTFMKESAFLKTYQRRNPEGGFIDEPELPYITIDESIVNAVTHRDYAIQHAIECEHYQDALIVRNPGRLLQRDRSVPNRFSLDDLVLDSMPRNPKLLQWLKLMRDERGAAFVRALSEGTRRMRDEMEKLKLPAPAYDVTDSQTIVLLESKAVERERAMQADSVVQDVTEYANIFELFITADGERRLLSEEFRREIITSLLASLKKNRWYIHSNKYGRIITHKIGVEIQTSPQVASVLRLFPAYVFQLREYGGRLYLCIDYILRVRNMLSVTRLCQWIQANTFTGRGVLVNWNGWQRGKIVSSDAEWTKVFLVDYGREEQVASDQVIPDLSLNEIEAVLTHQNIHFDLHRAIKEYGLALKPNAARIRSEKIIATANAISSTVFPLRVADFIIDIHSIPAALVADSSKTSGLPVRYLEEPSVEFSHSKESPDIRDGITRFGSYDAEKRSVELIPICLQVKREQMAQLIGRLQTGKYKYRGSERTFGVNFTYGSIITVGATEDIAKECDRLLREHPEWKGNTAISRVFLIQTPELGYDSDDENSPYYRIKRLLLESGLPCQMIDTPTLDNPDWKDLNLALNLCAKCGVSPWVLPDAIPDADFFIGLSYTENYRKNQDRLVGYANVFNKYGRWEFYSGNMQPFKYDERQLHYKELVRSTLERLSLSETPSVYFHYSAKYSLDDRQAILEAARSVRPNGTYYFLWINSHHNIRLFDNRPDTDGSLRRGGYVTTTPNQFFLSTTGFNPYRKTLGTPVMLEINAYAESPVGGAKANIDIKALALQVLNLTKLNWASTDSLCAEPITIKYAKDIAYLTAAFLRQDGKFTLHPSLEKTPWFI